MTGHPLDRPARLALATHHRALAEIEGGAMRYPPAVVPFAAVDEADPGALARLVRPGETAVFLEAGRVDLAPGFEEILRAEAVQMVAGKVPPVEYDRRIEPLGAADAAEMLALAEATRPGPFTLRALELGRFWGVRQGGRLVAMAGQRMAGPGFVELSGVCSAPEARGQGLARLLSLHVAARIAEAGDRPVLHAFASNTAALRLYESIGFSLRADFQVAVMKRTGGP